MGCSIGGLIGHAIMRKLRLGVQEDLGSENVAIERR